MAAPIIHFRIHFAKNANVGPGKIDLLEAIRRRGSLSSAARDLGMSYRRAWLLLQSLNNSFKKPVTLATTGGKGGGGAAVTQFGEQLIRSYRRLDRDISIVAATRLNSILPAVARRARPKSRAAGRSLRPRLSTR
jgi:molybdate transport system regulatory protein